jgi:predicted lipoprotein with Yx(FWY)xxD motif
VLRVIGRSGRLVAGGLVIASLLVAGCGGSDGGGGTAPAASATVSTKEVPGYGEVLATQGGKLLFVLTSDPEDGSKCDAACAEQWPPLEGQGELTAGPGVESGKLATIERADGKKQVTYNKRALYTTTGDELAGPGTKALGGTWFFISPDGEPVESTEAGGY